MVSQLHIYSTSYTVLWVCRAFSLEECQTEVYFFAYRILTFQVWRCWTLLSHNTMQSRNERAFASWSKVKTFLNLSHSAHYDHGRIITGVTNNINNGSTPLLVAVSWAQYQAMEVKHLKGTQWLAMLGVTPVLDESNRLWKKFFVPKLKLHWCPIHLVSFLVSTKQYSTLISCVLRLPKQCAVNISTRCINTQ